MCQNFDLGHLCLTPKLTLLTTYLIPAVLKLWSTEPWGIPWDPFRGGSWNQNFFHNNKFIICLLLIFILVEYKEWWLKLKASSVQFSCSVVSDSLRLQGILVQIKAMLPKSESESHSVVSDTLWPHGLCPWNSPGQNTGVGSLSLLWGIFTTKGSNPGLPHCRWILYQLSHKGSPRILEWVTYPFSRGFSNSGI